MFKRVSKKEGTGEIYYRDPLMSMSYASRLTARILMNAWVIIHVSATVVLTLSDVQWAFWLGILNAMYLIDRLIRYGDGDRDLPIDNKDVGNLASYLSPRARRIILSSYNKASIVGGGFFLNAARALTEVKSVQNMLNRLEVDRGEIDAKLDAYLGKETASYKDKARLLHEVEHLVLAAFYARVDGQRFIDYADLFAALHSVGSEELSSLFSLFDVDESSLQRAAVFGRSQTGAGPAFGGGSGELLDKLIAEVGWKREDIYITNVVKRRPPDNRDPSLEEIAAYTPSLSKQIEIINPKIISPLGRFAMNYFLPTAKISKDQGRLFWWGNILIIPLYHPAAALRSTGVLDDLRASFRKLPVALKKYDKFLKERVSIEEEETLKQSSLF